MKKKAIIIAISIVIFALIATLVLFFANKKAEEDEKNAVYTVNMSLVDDQSPARFLNVYRNGKKIEFKEVRYMDDILLCKGTNPTIHFSELGGEEELKVVLKNDKIVVAKIEKGDI